MAKTAAPRNRCRRFLFCVILQLARTATKEFALRMTSTLAQRAFTVRRAATDRRQASNESTHAASSRGKRIDYTPNLILAKRKKSGDINFDAAASYLLQHSVYAFCFRRRMNATANSPAPIMAYVEGSGVTTVVVVPGSLVMNA